MDTRTSSSPRTQAMSLALKIALPLLLVGLVVGLLVSIFQAVTQIQEQTLTFIPKIVAMAVVLVVGGPWMLDQLLDYTTELCDVDPRRWSGVTQVTAPRSCIAEFGEQQVARVLPRARAHLAAVRAGAAVLAQDGPARACAASSPSALAIGLSPVVDRTAQPSRPTCWRSRRCVVKELLVGARSPSPRPRSSPRCRVAGSFLDTSIGFSYGGLVDPVTGNQSAVLSPALPHGRRRWCSSRSAATPGSSRASRAPTTSSGCSTARRSARWSPAPRTRSPTIFACAIEVAGPVLLALILTDAAFGVVSRVVPQLNVFAVGFPAKVDRRPAARRRLAAVRRRLDLATSCRPTSAPPSRR